MGALVSSWIVPVMAINLPLFRYGPCREERWFFFPSSPNICNFYLESLGKFVQPSLVFDFSADNTADCGWMTFPALGQRVCRQLPEPHQVFDFWRINLICNLLHRAKGCV